MAGSASVVGAAVIMMVEGRGGMVGVQYNINNNTNVNHDGSVNLALPPTQFCIKNFPSFV